MASTPKRPLRVGIEGNIASGKSTLLDLLRKNFRITTVPEPVGKWQKVPSEGGDETGHNMLELFYQDPHRWAYTFQSYAFLSRLQAQIAPQPIFAGEEPPDMVVYERSVFSDKHIFGLNCRDMGLFNQVEWGIYNDWHAWLVSSFDVHLDAVIYLQTSPETCMDRVKKRKRSEETTVSLDYLRALHGRHESWLCPVEGDADWCGAEPPRLLVVDGDAEFENDPARRAQVMVEIQSFLSFPMLPDKV